MVHLLARQQKIHDLMRGNTRQALLRQKLNLLANAYNKGDPVSVDESLAWAAQGCPCTTGWPGLNPRLRTKNALRTAETSSYGEVVVPERDPERDPEPERSAGEILEYCSKPSFREEEPLSEVSNVPLPSKKRHWMDTRLRTRMRAGDSCLHYQQFDYSSSDPERPRSEDLMSDAPDHSGAEPPALLEPLMPPDEQNISPEPAKEDDLPLFSQQWIIPELSQMQDVPTATADAEVSLSGTSAPLLTNPPLSNVPVSFPPLPVGISNLPDTEARNTGLSSTDELAARHNVPSTRGKNSISLDTSNNLPVSGFALARKDEVAEDVLEVALLGGPEDTLPLQGKQLVKLTHSHQLHRILILMRVAG